MTIHASHPEKRGMLVTMASGGALAGAELLLGGHAIDRIKTWQQAHPDRNSCPGIKESARQIYQIKGLAGFYDGFRWNVLSHCGKTAMRWTFLGKLQTFSNQIVPSVLQKPHPYLQPILLAALMSTIESVSIQCLTESMKTKEMQSSASCYPIGFKRIFNGCDAVIARQFISWTSFLICHKEATDLMVKATHKTSKKDLSLSEQFAVGMVTGIFNTMITGPIDVVKTQMQKPDPIEGRTFYSAARAVLKRHGLFAFTRGVPIKMFRSSLFIGVNTVAMAKFGIL